MTAEPSSFGPGPGYKTDWAEWAKHAPMRKCVACEREYQPNHPRRQFCQRPDCPGPQRNRSTGRRPQGRARAQARATGVQGFIADVLLAVQHHDAPTGDRKAINDAVRGYIAAEVSRDRRKVYAAGVRLAAALAHRVVGLVPHHDRA